MMGPTVPDPHSVARGQKEGFRPVATPTSPCPALGTLWPELCLTLLKLLSQPQTSGLALPKPPPNQ